MRVTNACWVNMRYVIVVITDYRLFLYYFVAAPIWDPYYAIFTGNTSTHLCQQELRSGTGTGSACSNPRSSYTQPHRQRPSRDGEGEGGCTWVRAAWLDESFLTSSISAAMLLLLNDARLGSAPLYPTPRPHCSQQHAPSQPCLLQEVLWPRR